MSHHTRLTDRHDVPQAAFMLLFYAVVLVAAGAALRGGWELMGWLLGT